jgi:hypothetical protein
MTTIALQSSIQRKAEAAALYLGHLQNNRIVLANQREAIKQAKRNAKKWNAAARQEFIKSKINSATV